MIETIRPMDIEKRSFEIITELLGDRKLDPEQAPVIKRVIHTSADFDYADNLVFSPGAVRIGLEALRSGCDMPEPGAHYPDLPGGSGLCPGPGAFDLLR